MLMSFCLSPHWPQYIPCWSIKFLLSLDLSAFWRPYLCSSACKTSGWFIETKTQRGTVLAALPEYCVSYTLCSYLCPCHGLFFDSLCVVQKREQTFYLSEKLLRSLGIKGCFSTCIPHKAAISVSRHWLGKFRQGIMCKWEHDSVVGKIQTNTRCLQGWITNKTVKKSKKQEMMEELDLAFICLFQQDMQIPPFWHHCLISPHQCLMTQPLSIALSQHLCDLLLATQDGVKGCP